MHESNLAAFILTLISASGYVAATYFMKLWDRLDAVPVIALITAALIVAVVSEMIVLKNAKMGQVYFIIIGLECLLVAVFAKLALKESYTFNELAGMAIIVCGVAVFQIPDWATGKAGTTETRDAETATGNGKSTAAQ